MNIPTNPYVLLSPTAAAHRLLMELVTAGDIVMDATAGNGHDTLFLAERVGETGKVIAFDVQEKAIASTRARVEAAGYGGVVEVFQKSHALMEEHAEPGSVAAVMFNLGYLPGTGHAFATGPDTIAALEISARLIRQGGALSVVCYPGHRRGNDEASLVEAWMTQLADDQWKVVKHSLIGALSPVPFLLFAVKGKRVD